MNNIVAIFKKQLKDTVWFACMLEGVVICAAGGYNLQTSIIFMCIMAVGILTSLLVGSIIGIWSKTQMMATSIAVPVMMIFAFMELYNVRTVVTKFTFLKEL